MKNRQIDRKGASKLPCHALSLHLPAVAYRSPWIQITKKIEKDIYSTNVLYGCP